MSAGGGLLHGLLAVARLAVREALRSRLVLVVALALALGIGGLCWTATGDGTPEGRFKAFMAWSLGWSSLVLSLTTVFLSTTLAQGLRDGRLVPLSVGPLPREGLVLGWWLGQAVVVAGLVLLATGLLWALAHVVALGTPGRWFDPALDAQRAREQARIAPLLAARAVARPPAPDDGDLPELSRRALGQLQAQGRLDLLGPDEREGVRARIEDDLRQQRRSVSRGQLRTWRIDGITPDAGAEVLTLRFRYSARSAEGGLPEGKGPHGWLSVHPPDGVVGHLQGTWAGDVTHEVPVPSRLLSRAVKPGEPAPPTATTLLVDYLLDDERPVVVVFPDEGPEILYPSGGLAGNVLRAGLVLLGRLLFLLAVGVAAAALIDGKLAALLALFVLAVGSASGFLADSIQVAHPFDSLGPLLASLLGGVLEGTLWILPDLARDELGDLLSQGELVSWTTVGLSLGGDALARGGAVLLGGALLFGRRELGAVR